MQHIYIFIYVDMALVAVCVFLDPSPPEGCAGVSLPML